MPVLHRDDVSVLLEPHEPPCLSLFLPTHHARNGGQQDPLRLRNLVDDGVERLKALGLRAPEAQDIVRPARGLLEDGRFWRQQTQGLAVFLSPGWHLVVRAPFALPELLAVSGRFHVRPLLQGLSPDERFHLLALSRHGARLFVGPRFELSAVDVPDMPHGMQDIERYLVHEKQLQGHAGPRGGGSPERMLHGHGPGDDPADERVVEYFRQVDKAVVPHLHGTAPLVLAAVEYLLPAVSAGQLYGTSSTRPWSAARTARRSTSWTQRAWAIVDPRVQVGGWPSSSATGSWPPRGGLRPICAGSSPPFVRPGSRCCSSPRTRSVVGPADYSTAGAAGFTPRQARRRGPAGSRRRRRAADRRHRLLAASRAVPRPQPRRGHHAVLTDDRSWRRSAPPQSQEKRVAGRRRGRRTRARPSARRLALRLTLVYVVAASLWIIFSDRVLGAFDLPIAVEREISSVKGLLFVAVTGLILWLLSARWLDGLRASEERYLRLFENSTEGLTVFRVVRDRQGQAEDLVVDDMNPTQSMRQHITRELAVGRHMRDCDPLDERMCAHFEFAAGAVRSAWSRAVGASHSVG